MSDRTGLRCVKTKLDYLRPVAGSTNKQCLQDSQKSLSFNHYNQSYITV